MPDRLPNELLSSVFRALDVITPIEGPKPRPEPYETMTIYGFRNWNEWPTRHLWGLCHVSRNWREVVMADSLLWTTYQLQWVPTRWREFALSMWEAELRLCGNNLLKVYIGLPKPSKWTTEILDRFLQEEHRWSSLVVLGIEHYSRIKLLSHMRVMPRLVLLRLEIFMDYSGGKDPLSPFLAHNPPLIELEARVLFRPESAPIPLPLAHLRWFCYEGAFEDAYFLNSLISLKHVTHLQLKRQLVYMKPSRTYLTEKGDHYDCPDDPRRHSVCWEALSSAWSNLQSLSIQTLDVILHQVMFQNLTLPRLTSLSISRIDPSFLPHLLEFITNSGCRIEHLSIGTVIASRFRFDALFASLSHLRYVSFQCAAAEVAEHADYAGNSFLHALTIRKTGEVPCPRLETLVLRDGHFDGSDFVKMLEGRLRRGVTLKVKTHQCYLLCGPGEGDSGESLKQTLSQLKTMFPSSNFALMDGEKWRPRR